MEAYRLEGGSLLTVGACALVYSQALNSKQVNPMARANEWTGKVLALIKGGNTAAAIAQIKALGEGESQRRGMRAQPIFGALHILAAILFLGFDARVDGVKTVAETGNDFSVTRQHGPGRLHQVALRARLG